MSVDIMLVRARVCVCVGGYLETAGRIPTLDALAAKLASSSDASTVSEIEAALASDEVKTHKHSKFAKFYLIAAQKVAAAKDWAANEVTRLQRMLDKGGVNAKNFETFMMRINIAKAFQKQE